MSRPSWHQYYMTLARVVATKSKDTTQVGALLIGDEGEIRLTAYNGPPRGVQDVPERFERPAKYLYASHAEANLIAFAAREGIRTKGCTVVVTHMPCASCARTLIQAGITRIICGPGTTSMPSAEFSAAAEMFNEAGVTITKDQSCHTSAQSATPSKPRWMQDDMSDAREIIAQVFRRAHRDACYPDASTGECEIAASAIAAALTAAGYRILGPDEVDPVTAVRPIDEWHEDYGDVVWWARLEGEWIGEAAWIGTPNDSDWPGYHTHWSPHPPFPRSLGRKA